METLRKVYDVCLVNNVRRHCLPLRPNASSNHRTDTKVVKNFTLYVYVRILPCTFTLRILPCTFT